jgi:Ni2+-binding GTPase involved in maturation of urease and hydrogenase
MQEYEAIGRAAILSFLRRIRNTFSISVVFGDRKYNIADFADKTDAQIHYLLTVDGCDQDDVDSMIDIMQDFRLNPSPTDRADIDHAPKR